ncbi:MAG: MBL fold metallo-hydrolase [Bryobacteraceae bacterium]
MKLPFLPRRFWPSAAASLFTITAIVGGVVLLQPFLVQMATAQGRPSGDLDVVKLRDNVYIIAGAGGNITVHIGQEGIVLVDTGTAASADKVIAELNRLTQGKVRYIINTGADADHVGGNGAIAKVGRTLFPGGGGGGGGVGEAVTNNGGAAILAHDNVNLRMSAPTGKQSAFPTTDWPTETFTGKGKSVYLNGDGIQAMQQPAAHSDADSIVFFRRADVIAAGDVFDMNRFPVIDIDNGGSIQGEIDALNRLLDLAIPPVPLVWVDARTLIVPGHGRVADHADLTEYRDMVTIIRDRIQDLMKQGMTLDQVKKANPTQGYRKRWGAESGQWTTDRFVEAIYRGLSAKK